MFVRSAEAVPVEGDEPEGKDVANVTSPPVKVTQVARRASPSPAKEDEPDGRDKVGETEAVLVPAGGEKNASAPIEAAGGPGSSSVLPPTPPSPPPVPTAELAPTVLRPLSDTNVVPAAAVETPNLDGLLKTLAQVKEERRRKELEVKALLDQEKTLAKAIAQKIEAERARLKQVEDGLRQEQGAPTGPRQRSMRPADDD
jgi:hypothetical protein